MGSFQSCACAKENLGFYWLDPKACGIQKDFVPLHPLDQPIEEKEMKSGRWESPAQPTKQQTKGICSRKAAHHVRIEHVHGGEVEVVSDAVSIDELVV